MGLSDIRKFLNGLKLIWICKFANDDFKQKSITSAMLLSINTLKVLGPCLPLNNSKLNLLWMNTLLAYKKLLSQGLSFEELSAAPLFYNLNISVGYKTIFHRRWSGKGVYHISHLLHEHAACLDFAQFKLEYGLNVDCPTFCTPMTIL